MYYRGNQDSRLLWYVGNLARMGYLLHKEVIGVHWCWRTITGETAI